LKLILLNGASIASDETTNITKFIYNSLENLDIEVESIFLEKNKLPYYYNKTTKEANEVFDKISEADGVIVLAEISSIGIKPYMSVLLEYLNETEYKNSLINKHLYVITVSNTDTEKEFAIRISNYFLAFDMIDCGYMGLTAYEAKNIENSKLTKEKLKHNLEIFNKVRNVNMAKEKESLVLNNKENNVSELAQLIKKQLEIEKTEKKEEPVKKCDIKTYTHELENKTACMVADIDLSKNKDLKTIVQLKIEGNTSFLGVIYINTEEARYKSGETASSDLTITTTQEVWEEIVNKKIELQRSFMTGKIKVKGNFGLLRKLDEIIK